MGLMDHGRLLSWEESKAVAHLVKKYGIQQFINSWSFHGNRMDPSETLKWGEEIEFMILEFDYSKQEVRTYNKSEEIIELANSLEKVLQSTNGIGSATWLYEFGRYMVESTPGVPYDLSLNSVFQLQRSMSYRRWKLSKILPENVKPTSLTSFPGLGTSYYLNSLEPQNLEERMSRSVFLPDAVVTAHPRFPALARNIFLRRHAKVTLLVPIFNDTHTKTAKHWEHSVSEPIDRFELQRLSEITPNPVRDKIYMDAMGFGMGMCCSQSTYMCSNMSDARYLYDQFAVLAPLWLAMTACTSLLRGMIAGTDTRWDVLSGSVDCRTAEEMNTIPKSRYASVSLYVSDRPALAEHVEEYNDLDVPVNTKVYEHLQTAGLDPILSKHVAYLYIRDPLVIFEESLEKGTSLFKSHFDNIQSTNWNSVRLKPPPSTSVEDKDYKIGWRVEFRPSELQLTDFENAAFISLVMVLVKVFFRDRCELYIPMTLNDDNFERSKRMNAMVNEKFWFRRDINANTSDRSYALMSLREIFLGSDSFSSSSDVFSSTPSNGQRDGLMLRCIRYVEDEFRNGGCTKLARDTLYRYFDFISLRLRGNIDSNATFLRKLVMAHPDYKHDSVVPKRAVYDVCQLAARVGSLSMQIPELYGPFAADFNSGFETCMVSQPFQGQPMPLSWNDTAGLAVDTNASVLSSTGDTQENSSITVGASGISNTPQDGIASAAVPRGAPNCLNDIRRYLYSLCETQPGCSDYLKGYYNSMISDSTLTPSVSDTSVDTIRESSSADASPISSEDSVAFTDSTVSTISHAHYWREFGMLYDRLHDFVISEDFTKFWMTRKWLEIEYNMVGPTGSAPPYTDNLGDLSELHRYNRFDSENDWDYFRIVHVLSS